MNNIIDFNEKLKCGLLDMDSYNVLLNGNVDKINEKKDALNLENKISIIIPTFNRIQQLKVCVNSILNQSYENFEIIIIDDSNNNETYNVFYNCLDKRIRYFKNEYNLGAGLNRQKGYNLSTGDYIIFCDDDDYYIDNHLFENIIETFRDNDINIICYGSYVHFEKEDNYKYKKFQVEGKILSLDYLRKFNYKIDKPNSTFSAAFRKLAIEKADFKNMKMMNDTSIYLRALMIGGFTYFYNKIIGIYRIHGKNMTFNINLNFLIDNLNEKKIVYDYLKTNSAFIGLHKWYINQLEITIRYYLENHINNKENLKLMLKWVKNNISKFEAFKLIIYILKIKIKVFLKNRSYNNEKK